MDFAKIYEDYNKDIYRFVLSLCKNHNLAVDICHETFAKAMDKIDTFDGSQDIRAWLFTIARNTLYDFYRKHNKTNTGFDLNLVEDKKISFVENIADKDLALKVHTFLHSMNEPYKEVFNLRVFGELDFKSIGQIFGKTDNWARVTFYRAKNMIIDYLEEENEI
ncbi:Sigma-70 region 2 [Anaerococcus lactolyticus ATCC 51172]|uniref:Sigma-70 region 2 n=1 Tax=Anaerococcus lactolyticus ATCC 51172 TaxID=525254 RepID=C2BFS3_9FIRM|nr:sigma-70 family RNA polymerase sigma factor [Anaerococcus lactolyticus]EEI86183.1 Sigma-70 region 2 [Anaerococcus lactolyticus ATCC 51172]